MIHREKLLIVKDITKIFPVGGWLSKVKLAAVNKVSFEIEADKPEILALVGESGSGKTTLARIILRLAEPTYGSIFYKGKDVTKIRTRQEELQFMETVQPIFQNPFESFNPLKRIDTYLYETAVNYRVAHKANPADKVVDVVDRVLALVGLSLQEVRGRYPHELSGGQLQRVSIARALIVRPSLLIADEPVSMLDVSLRMSIVNLFKELKNEHGASMIYITHDLATAYYISDRIAIMLRGNVVELGSVEGVLVNPLHPYTRTLKESVPEPTPSKKWSGRIELSALEVEEFSKVGCKYAGRCPLVMDICKREEPRDFLIEDRMVKCWLFKGKKG